MAYYDVLGDGDSNMVNGGSYVLDSYLSAIGGSTKYLYAHSGDTSKDVLAKINAAFIGNTYGEYLLLIGTNDVTRRISLEPEWDTDEKMVSYFMANLSATVDIVQGYGTEVILLPPPPRWFEDAQYYPNTPTIHETVRLTKLLYAAMRQVAVTKGCVFSDDWDHFITKVYKEVGVDGMDTSVRADHLHLNVNGGTIKGTHAATATVPTNLDLVTGKAPGYGWGLSTSLIGNASVSGDSEFGTLVCTGVGDGAKTLCVVQSVDLHSINRHDVIIDGDSAKFDVYMRASNTNIVRDYDSVPWIKTRSLISANGLYVQAKIIAKEAATANSITIKITVNVPIPAFKFSSTIMIDHTLSEEDTTDDLVFKAESAKMFTAGKESNGNDFMVFDSLGNIKNTRALFMDAVNGIGEIAFPASYSTTADIVYTVKWGAATPIANTHTMDSRLATYYNMSNDPRNGVYDAAARQNLAGASGDASYTAWTGNELVSGLFHKAIQFDGTQVNYTSSKRFGAAAHAYGYMGGFDTNTDHSIRSVFTLPTATFANNSMIISNGYMFGLVVQITNGIFTIYFVNDVPSIAGITPLLPDTIYDVVFTINASTKLLSLFINGDFVKSWTVTSLGSNRQNWMIGSLEYYYSGSYALMHHISFYQSLLGANTVKRLYNNRLQHDSLVTFGKVLDLTKKKIQHFGVDLSLRL